MARNWKIVGKYPQPNALGVIEGTHVIITGDDGASIPQTIKKDLSSTNDLDVIKM
ncbi:TPA: hypothetical protein SUH51_002017, partial [Streptococcus equi subsp. equi]|nr:hypothetical protein [Streptococcus equi subsp. equi]